MLPRPRLRTILLLVNLVVLGVPILAVAALQIYDTQLVRQTEAEVISQTAHLKAHAEHQLTRIIEESDGDESPAEFGRSGEIDWPREFFEYRPLEPVLDSSTDEIRPPEAPPKTPSGSADPLLNSVGERIEPAMRQAQRTTMSGMAVVDWRGHTVATTNQSQEGKSLRHREEIEGALDGDIVRILRRREHIPEGLSLESVARETSNRVFMAMPLTRGDRIVGAAMVWRTPKSLPQALYDNRTAFGLLLVVMLLGGLTIAGLTAFYIGRPIERLIDQTDRAAREEGDGSEPIAKPGTREVQRLSESIAAMASSLQERADYIRTFARSVSHEFKTPLTSIRGTVELLDDHLEEMSDDERQNFLEMLDDDARRLEQLVGRLLELAKADVATSDDEHCDIAAVASEVADTCGGADFDVIVDGDDIDAIAAIAADALESALTNLVVNAQRYGGDRVSISIEAGDADRFILRVEDNGPGISEGNAERIFDEFFTTARDSGGTGLGLSITRALLEAHGGSIRYVPTDGGACFELSLPAVAEPAIRAE